MGDTRSDALCPSPVQLILATISSLLDTYWAADQATNCWICQCHDQLLVPRWRQQKKRQAAYYNRGMKEKPPQSKGDSGRGKFHDQIMEGLLNNIT